MHPADFLDKNDLNPNLHHSLERLNNSDINQKIKSIHDIFELIIDNGFQGEKINNIANEFRK